MPQSDIKTALGLMSGTSMDGIDVALVKTDGESLVEFGPSLSVEYEAAFRRRIEAALADALSIRDREERPGALSALEEEITLRHANAVRLFLRENSLAPSDIDVLGFHGQTVLHRPEQGQTVQLGDGQGLADATAIKTVYDMRHTDMTVGGQGAPLVPVFHQALARSLDRTEPVCFVNIGGISNITYIEGDELIAFDTGPGNALIDQWVQKHGGIPYDQGGRIASEGAVATPIVDRYMAAPFFDRSGPKSLDRGDFPPLEDAGVELADGARTLAHITALAIMRGAEHMPHAPKTWIICGGGRLNAMVMQDLRSIAAQEGGTVILAEEAGLSGDMLEAQAFAYLAVRSLKSLPLTFPKTTGCRMPVTGGVLARPHEAWSNSTSD